MPADRKPKAWNLKPKMTAAPELWEGCEILVPLWEGVGDPSSITVGMPGQVSGNSFGGWGFSGLGRHLVGPTGVDNSVVDGLLWSSLPSTLDSNKPKTMFIWGVFENTEGGENIYFCDFGENGGNTDGAQYRFRLDVGKPRVEASGGKYIGDTTVDDGNPHKVAFRNDGNTILGTGLWVDGQEVAQHVDSTDQSMVSGADTVTLFDMTPSGFTVSSMSSPCLMFGFWSRELTDVEMSLITRDPYAMLRPAGF